MKEWGFVRFGHFISPCLAECLATGSPLICVLDKKVEQQKKRSKGRIEEGRKGRVSEYKERGKLAPAH